MAKIQNILLRHIRLDGNTQARAAMNQAALDDYVEEMKNGKTFPAVVVFEDGENLLWLGDGFHRVAAAGEAGKKNIKAEIRPGTARDARLYSASKKSNGTHGARQSNADKRRAVEIYLDDPEWSAHSSREIAEETGVTHWLVNEIKKERVEGPSTADGKKQAPEALSSDDDEDDLGIGDPSLEDPFGHKPAPFAPTPNRVLDAIEELLEEPVKAAPLGQDQSLVPVTSEERARLVQLERLVLEKDEQLAATQELVNGIEADQEQIASLLRVVDGGGNLKGMMTENKRLMEDARICRARLAGAMNTINENKGWVKFWKDRHDGLIKKIQKARVKFDASGDQDALITEVLKALDSAVKPNPKAKACDEAMATITTEEEEYAAAFGHGEAVG